ncbi:MAG: CoA-binding protein, partial [Microbacteriaceae bacterium]
MSEQKHSYSDDELREVLENVQTIAVVGMSTDPAKAAHRIPKMLIEAGYTVIPVNPSAEEILGQKSYARLNDIPFPVDLVDVF